MADNWRQRNVCRYFKNGTCHGGNECRYRHVQTASRNNTNTSETDSTSIPMSNIPCRFFKYGTCKFGNQCHFLHSVETTDGTCPEMNTQENSSLKQRNMNSSASVDIKNTCNEDSIHLAEEWVKAPEFIPSNMICAVATASSSNNATSSTSSIAGASKPVTYAQVVNPNGKASEPSLEPLCPFAEATGNCKKLNCVYLHGDICELCGHAALHPHNEELRKKHTNECVKQHEVDMELSFAIQRSREKSCGVCFETIMEKSSKEQRFGILPNCNHCFCLTCIRKWRQAKQFDNKIIRACPECRVTSDFVCPSMYWVDTKEEKEKLITDYKYALSMKDCKYFNKGRGKCPFGNKCFYLHALPDGTKADVGPPLRQRRNADSETDIIQQLILWDFLEERDDQWMYITLEDIIPFSSDSDDSDWSDFELNC